MVLPSVHSCDLRESQEVQSFRCRATGDLVVVVLQCSKPLELSLSRDRLSGILPCLLLSLAYGSSPEMLIVDLIHLVEHLHECLAPTVASLLQKARNKASKASL